MKNEGIVYFFKHNNIDAIKIGLTKSTEIIRRFTVFKTYAPFGAECIGIIRTNNCVSIEKQIHKKFTKNRINLRNEWFNITIETAKKVIKQYDGELNPKLSVFENIDINEVKNLNKKTAIIKMHGLNYSRIEICQLLKTQYSYVSKIINSNNPDVRYKRRVI